MTTSGSFNLSADCYRCGYDLRGIPDDKPCPECGLLAGRSRRASDELHLSRPKWLGCLKRGSWLILIAILLAIIWSLVARQALRPIWGALSFASLSTLERNVPLEFSGDFLAAALFWLGVMLITSREGYAPADKADAARRRLSRLFALAPFAGFIAFTGTIIANYRLYWRDPISLVMVEFVSVLPCIPIPALLLLHLRALAIRVRSPHLAEHCSIVAGGSSVAIALFALTLWVSTGDNVTIAGNSTTARLFLSLLFASLLAGLLFLLWWMYLFVRFTIAFHHAALLGRKTWVASDLSATATADPGNAAAARL